MWAAGVEGLAVLCGSHEQPEKDARREGASRKEGKGSQGKEGRRGPVGALVRTLVLPSWRGLE